MKHLRNYLGAILLLLTLLLGNEQVVAQQVDYESLSKNPNVECIKLSGLMLKMGMAATKQEGADGKRIAKAFERVKKMYVFSSENKKGRDELIKGFTPLTASNNKLVEVLLDHEDTKEGERVRVIGVNKGNDIFEVLLVLSEERNEANAVVMFGDMGKEDLLLLAKSAE